MLYLKHSFRWHRGPGPGTGGHGNQRLALAAMAISSGVTSIPTSAVAVVIPEIHSEFNSSLGELQWTLVGFSLSYSVLLVLAGRLADVYGRKLFFLIGTVVYAAAALAAGVAPNTTVLIVAVVLMGAGAAILTPASLSIITDAFEPARRGTAIGIWAAASALISTVGPAIGGVLGAWSWRSVFWINAPLAALFFAMTLLAARESRDSGADRHVDASGLATLAGGLTALTLVLNEGQQWGWLSARAIILFASAAVLLAAFVVLEPRVRNALVDFRFFRKRNFLGSNLALLVANFALAAILCFLPLYMEEVLGYSVIKAGLLLLPLGGTMGVALPLGGKISDRIGPRSPIVAGLAVTTVGCYLLTFINGDSGYNDIWPGSLLVGAGVGLALTPLNTAAMNSIRRRAHGAAAGVLVTMSGIGATFGVALSGALFQSRQDSQTDSLLSATHLGLYEAQERAFSGLLAGSQPALHALQKLPGPAQAEITHAVRQGFTDGLGAAIWLALGITAAGMVLVAVVMQRAAPLPEEDEPDRLAAVPASV